jgi:uroporphyrinogen decarboxylase
MFSHLHRPDFERFAQTLMHRHTSEVPLIELGIHPTIKQSLLGRPINTLLDDIDFMRSMGYDFIKIQPGFDLELNRSVVSSARSGGAYTNISDRAWAVERQGLITNWEQFEKYPWPTSSEITYARFEEARTILPDGMGIIGQYGDIFTNTWELMGYETFAIAIYEQPNLVEAIYQRLANLILGMFDVMASMDWIGALWYSDDIAFSSGLLVSPDFLRRLFFPDLQRIGELAKRRGIPFIYHTDGILWDVMDDIVASGVTALHPIEPKAMDIVEVQQRYGDRLCLCGGIEVDLLARGTPDQIRSTVSSYLEKLSMTGSWCAGSSNSIPEYVPVENYVAMVETVLNYRCSTKRNASSI